MSLYMHTYALIEYHFWTKEPDYFRRSRKWSILFFPRLISQGYLWNGKKFIRILWDIKLPNHWNGNIRLWVNKRREWTSWKRNWNANFMYHSCIHVSCSIRWFLSILVCWKKNTPNWVTKTTLDKNRNYCEFVWTLIFMISLAFFFTPEIFETKATQNRFHWCKTPEENTSLPQFWYPSIHRSI